MISSENERADAAKEWAMYITVSCLFILIVSVICFFAPVYRLQDLLFRMFDAVIICVLTVNGLYYLKKIKASLAHRFYSASSTWDCSLF
ncbi:hypothetical protein HMPREF1012_02006 [Bacillus sp. BT1B_CT2]|uniref:hypothetical protein n=1 Tax=Bacillus TaxID=1386 RepID=UPI0001F442E2|nr:MULTISPECIES: hypothetical protein [Bacillus]EFV72126.1 hypothetical protein HMPREF1012_02006 [Bacillus sp. BT1B_CT2]